MSMLKQHLWVSRILHLKDADEDARIALSYKHWFSEKLRAIETNTKFITKYLTQNQKLNKKNHLYSIYSQKMLKMPAPLPLT